MSLSVRVGWLLLLPMGQAGVASRTSIQQLGEAMQQSNEKRGT